MKEKVLEAFAELGFELTPMEELGFGFDYENIHMLYLPQANDDDFLNISIPGIYDVEEENPIAFLESNRLIYPGDTSMTFAISWSVIFSA